jgi:hypothetical protein
MMTAPPRADRLVHSEASTAKLLGIPVSTLIRWRKGGQGPSYVLLGRRICYRDADLQDWLLSRRHFPGEARQDRSATR